LASNNRPSRYSTIAPQTATIKCTGKRGTDLAHRAFVPRLKRVWRRLQAQSAHSTRWTARVRFNGRDATDAFSTIGCGCTWTRSSEFERRSVGVIFADLVDALLEHRKGNPPPLGKTAAKVIERLKSSTV